MSTKTNKRVSDILMYKMLQAFNIPTSSPHPDGVVGARYVGSQKTFEMTYDYRTKDFVCTYYLNKMPSKVQYYINDADVVTLLYAMDTPHSIAWFSIRESSTTLMQRTKIDIINFLMSKPNQIPRAIVVGEAPVFYIITVEERPTKTGVKLVATLASLTRQKGMSNWEYICTQWDKDNFASVYSDKEE